MRTETTTAILFLCIMGMLVSCESNHYKIYEDNAAVRLQQDTTFVLSPYVFGEPFDSATIKIEGCYARNYTTLPQGLIDGRQYECAVTVDSANNVTGIGVFTDDMFNYINRCIAILGIPSYIGTNTQDDNGEDITLVDFRVKDNCIQSKTYSMGNPFTTFDFAQYTNVPETDITNCLIQLGKDWLQYKGNDILYAWEWHNFVVKIYTQRGKGTPFPLHDMITFDMK